MATVYKAYDTRLERDVAVKVIRAEPFPPEQLEQILKRFEREAKALATALPPQHRQGASTTASTKALPTW